MLRFFPLLLLLLVGCATPVPPTGGPADTTPPRLVESTPAPDSVRVRTDRIALRFSKPIDENSLRQAFSITPELTGSPRVVVRGRDAEIALPDSLRPNTTYVVTLGTELRDLRNNRLPAPITLAFATGDQLDRGAIEGIVADPRSGAGVRGMNLFAYALDLSAATSAEDTLAALPDPRITAPDYRTETDQQGAFRLDYLRDADYFVVAVEDLNRNRRADAGERFAVPRRPAVRADSAAPPRLDLFATRADTTAPTPVRVRPQTDRTHVVRFSEPVQLAERDPAAFALADTTTGSAVAVETVYADEDPFQIVLRTAPLPAQPHRLTFPRPEAVRDSVGNALVPSPLVFVPATAEDTEIPTLLSVRPAGDTLRLLRPGQVPVLRFSSPPDTTALGLAVTAETGEPLPFTLVTTDGVRYRVETAAAQPFTLAIPEADTTRRLAFAPLPADSLGRLEGRVLDVPEAVPVTVELRLADGITQTAVLRPDDTFAFDQLPGESVRLRVFEDPTGSGRWDGGRLAPYRPPARLRLLDPVRVRPRWDTELEPIRFDAPISLPEDEPSPAAEPFLDAERDAREDAVLGDPPRDADPPDTVPDLLPEP